MESIFYNSEGVKSVIRINLEILRQHHISGEDISAYLESLEEIEDIIDIELSKNDGTDDWIQVKKNLQNRNKLNLILT